MDRLERLTKQLLDRGYSLQELDEILREDPILKARSKQVTARLKAQAIVDGRTDRHA